MSEEQTKEEEPESMAAALLEQVRNSLTGLQGLGTKSPPNGKKWEEEMAKLVEENEVLKRCLRLMRDNSALETASILSAVISFCDKKFRKQFADGMDGIVSKIAEKVSEGDLFERPHKKTRFKRRGTKMPRKTEFFEDSSDRVQSDSRYEKPERDVPHHGRMGGAWEEQPVRDTKFRRGKRKLKKICGPLCPKIPPVSLGGRQLPHDAPSPYFYPSEPDSRHMQSHMQTCTPVISDLEYDALYLKSLALAAGYRAMAKGLSGEDALNPDDFKEYDLDKLCKRVAEIPPYVLYRRKQPKARKLIHTCVVGSPTKCHPFTREGIRQGEEERPPDKPKQFRQGTYSCGHTHAGGVTSAGAAGKGGNAQAKLSGGGQAKPGTGGDYDFEAVVEPIIDQARQTIGQTAGVKPPEGDLAAYSLQHTHKEFVYKEDGTAQAKDDKGRATEEEEVDIDLNDPEVAKAAVKIQAGFRGHLARSGKSGNGSEEIHLTNDPHPRKLSATGDRPPGEDGPSGSESNKTNNYRNRETSSQGTSASAEDLVSRDIDWANHCSATSPFQVVEPRSPPAKEQPFVLPQPVILSKKRLGMQQSADLMQQMDLYALPNQIPDRASVPQASTCTSLFSPAVSGLSPVLSRVSPEASFKDEEEYAMRTKTGSSESSMLGEVAFQLERRILDYVFAESLPDAAVDRSMATKSRQLCEYTVHNIGQMISREALAGEKYSRGTERMLRERLGTVLDILTPMGYDLLDHGAFSQEIINKYGLLARPPSTCNNSGAYTGTEVGIPGIHVADVQNYIFSASETDHERDNLLLIFDCLRMLAIEDGRPLFIW